MPPALLLVLQVLFLEDRELKVSDRLISVGLQDGDELRLYLDDTSGKKAVQAKTRQDRLWLQNSYLLPQTIAEGDEE